MSASTAVAAPSPYQLAAAPVAGSRRRAVTLLAAATFPLALVVFVVLLLTVGASIGAGAALVVWAATVAFLVRHATRLALSGIDAAPAHPVDDARVHNLTESICVAAGLPKPLVLIVPDDRPNSLSLGMSAGSAAVLVTRGVTSRFNRLELEALLAHELSHIRRGDPAVATALAAIGAPMMAIAPGATGRMARRLRLGHESAADVAAVGLTRYPPALISALEKMRPEAMSAGDRRRATDLLWNVAPAGGDTGTGRAAPGGPDTLECRIEALLEL